MNTIKKILFVTVALPLGLVGLGALVSSCSEIDSAFVEFEEDNNLNDKNELHYSLIGIISKLQELTDRTIILGEVRNDLTTLTESATTDLKQLANFDVDINNKYNTPKDYFAVIQNCNFYLSRVDSLLKIRGKKVFEEEIAAIHGYRAWTYLQFALNYGTVPFVTEPILKEKDADPSLYPQYSIKEVCDYFIEDLKPYVDTDIPNDSPDMDEYIPIRILLGDLCLWSGKYQDAAKYYHDYLNKLGYEKPLSGFSRTDIMEYNPGTCIWRNKDFKDVEYHYNPKGAYYIFSIAMNANNEEYNGLTSKLDDIFSSTENNNYYFQATHSKAYDQLSQSQKYTLTYFDPVTSEMDTVSPPKDLIYSDELLRGDLRLSYIYNLSPYKNSNDKYNKYYLYNRKLYTSSWIKIYTISQVYLKFAEALNLAGYPQSAFAILKYGLCDDNYGNYLYVDDDEKERAGDLIKFNPEEFKKENTWGIHSLGCGNVECDTTYIIPELATREDSIAFVEQKILDEMALECSCEGTRFYDLMRYALRHNDNEFLANKIARRDGELNEDLYQRLLERKNWYLPLP
ncbi:MAG: hypothetical protein J5805_01370 [Bacteroidaceae bacterium]|nr:hypothetical protein [Bacteroidaceae bacterium]